MMLYEKNFDLSAKYGGRCWSNFSIFAPVTSDLNTPYQQVRQPTTPLYSRFYSNISRFCYLNLCFALANIAFYWQFKNFQKPR